MLPLVIPSWLPVFDEIVLVDTGSCDRSRQAALVALGLDPIAPWNARYTVELPSGRTLDAKLCEMPREDPMPMGPARNYAHDQASAAWTVAIDADEQLHVNMPDALRGYAAMAESMTTGLAPLIFLTIVSSVTGDSVRHSRMMRWPDGWRYKFPTDPKLHLPKVPPETELGKLLVNPDMVHILHLRSATRPDSLERKRRALHLMGPRFRLQGDALAHYDNVKDLIERRERDD